MTVVLFSCTHASSHDDSTEIISNSFTSNLRPRFVVGNEVPRYELEARMHHYGVPGVAIAVIKNNEIVSTKGYGVLQESSDETVNADTLFSAGSVSKIATAALLLKMHATQQFDIDKPVSSYLSSWNLAESENGSANDVSMRMIMSHTAGLNIHDAGGSRC